MTERVTLKLLNAIEIGMPKYTNLRALTIGSFAINKENIEIIASILN